MPRRLDLKKVMVIGSGPIVIGQAAEFDYAGAQACRALREEGISVILVNSNPATIMTDVEMADRVYIEPLTPEFLEQIIARERPQGLVPTLGGQTGLNLASKLSELGILEKYDVELLGTPLSTIQKAEDREQFRALMREIGEPVPESWIIDSDAALAELSVQDNLPWPLIVRPAYTLGGSGGGIAHTIPELLEIGGRPLGGLVASDLGFAAGPRLNAAGRLDDMSIGIRCLITDSPAEAVELAEIELRPMAGALAVESIGAARDQHLVHVHRVHHNPRVSEEVVEPSACHIGAFAFPRSQHNGDLQCGAC